jgi:peptide/nickel transport system substrate-binding protein
MVSSSSRGAKAPAGGALPYLKRRELLVLSALGLTARAGSATAAAPEGQLTFGVHVSLAPSWFDPAETTGLITPFMVLYALHDGLVKAMPGQLQASSLAESWSATEDGLTYDFVLRKDALFHNGEPVTSDDVKFSFGRYRGSDHDLLKQRVEAIETPDPQHVRIKLKQPWPDFLTFYAGATGAGWIVPRKYVETIGNDGFKKAPIGAGPYKYVSFKPGIELVLEAFEPYWRNTPRVKRLVLKVIPDESTRLAALKRGEIDIAYSIRGELAEEMLRTPGLSLKAPVPGAQWLYFADQWDPKSPWHDLRVRQAANLAMDRAGINKALTLGKSRLTNSIIPESFEFYWQPPEPVYDPEKAKRLLAEAGHPNGFDAGEFNVDASYSNVAEALLNNFAKIGIRTRLRPLERAAFSKAYGDKSLKNIIYGGSGAFGNAATRLEAFYVKGGTYVYGSYPDIDEMFQQQAVELDHKKRTAILHKMQQLAYERSIYAPMWLLGFLNGVGPRVAESGFGLLPGYAYTAPYEDITIKGS